MILRYEIAAIVSWWPSEAAPSQWCSRRSHVKQHDELLRDGAVFVKVRRRHVDRDLAPPAAAIARHRIISLPAAQCGFLPRIR